MRLLSRKTRKNFVYGLAGEGEIDRIRAQLNLIVPLNLAMFADMHAFEKREVVPGLKNAFARQM